MVVFLGATLESAAFLGFLVPGESLVLFAGFLAWAGLLELPALIVVVAAGAIVGDSIGYQLGRRLGREWILRHGPRLGVHGRWLERTERFFARHGGTTVFLGRFVGFLRAMAPFVAGASRMPYGRFLVFNIAGGLAWAVVTVLLGYSLGESWRIGERWLGRAGLGMAVAVVVLVVGAALWRRRQARRRG